MIKNIFNWIMVSFLVLSGVFSVACSSSSSNNPANPPVPPYVDLNGAGNSNNMGFSVSDGSWTYYSFITGIGSHDAGIYKVQADFSSTPVKIYNELGLYLTLLDGKLYFSNDGLWRMNTDGTGAEKILEIDGTFKNLIYYDEYFYFIDNLATLDHSDYGHIYRVKTDGTGKEQLGTATAYTLCIGEGQIFYRDEDDFRMYRMSCDGTGKQLIREGAVDQIAFYKNCLYFISMGDNTVNSTDLDGQDEHVVFESYPGMISHINVTDDYLYVSLMSLKHPNKNGVFRTPLSGGPVETLRGMKDADDWNFPYMSISGGKAYCLNAVWMGLVEMPFNYYRMNIDGTGFVMMWEEE
jgi:hypothetical protein